MSHPRPGGRSLRDFVLWSEDVAVGEQESVAYFNSPWGSKFTCGLLRLTGVFLRSGGVQSQGAVYKQWLLLFKFSAEGHRDTERPRRRFRGTHRNPQERPRVQSQSHTRTRGNAHIQPHTPRPTYVPNFLQSCCQTYIQFLVKDRGPCEPGSGLQPRCSCLARLAVSKDKRTFACSDDWRY
eukprot:bmy_20916T0